MYKIFIVASFKIAILSIAKWINHGTLNSRKQYSNEEKQTAKYTIILMILQMQCWKNRDKKKVQMYILFV